MQRMVVPCLAIYRSFASRLECWCLVLTWKMFTLKHCVCGPRLSPKWTMPCTFWRIPSWLPFFCRNSAVQVSLQWFHSQCETIFHGIHRWFQQNHPDDGNFGWHLRNGISVAFKNMCWFSATLCTTLAIFFITAAHTFMRSGMKINWRTLKLSTCSNPLGGFAVHIRTSLILASIISWAWEPCLHLVALMMSLVFELWLEHSSTLVCSIAACLLICLLPLRSAARYSR